MALQVMKTDSITVLETTTDSWLIRCRKIIFEGQQSEIIIQNICKISVEDGPFSLAWYGEQLPDKSTVMPVNAFPAETPFPESDGFGILSVPKSPAAVTWNQSRIFVVNRISSDMNFHEWQSVALSDGYEAVVAIPVIHPPHPKGIFVLYSRNMDPVNRGVLKSLEEISTLLGRTLAILAEKSIQKKEIDFLTKQEEMYHSVFENTGTGTIIIDYDMTIMHANARFLSMVGYTRDEVQNRMKWSQFVIPTVSGCPLISRSIKPSSNPPDALRASGNRLKNLSKSKYNVFH